MKRWLIPLALGAIALVALAAAFGVGRAAASSMHLASTGAQSSSATCDRLMSDPAAAKTMQPLHAEHAKDMQAWQAPYSTDPQSNKAQAALETMRNEHVREMRAAFKKLGMKAPGGACDPDMVDGMDMGGMNGSGMMDGEADGMMGDPGDSGDAHEEHHDGDVGTDDSGGTTGMMGGSTF